MTDEEKDTLADRWLRRVKNQRIVAALIVFGVVVSAVETFTGVVRNAYQEIVGPEELSGNDVLLTGTWQWVFKESESIRSGEELRGKLAPSSTLKLALRNAGRRSVTNIAVGIEGNARTIAEASGHFQGSNESERPYLLTTFWRSKPGVVLSAVPKGEKSQELALQLTTLDLGKFSWERNEGIYHLRIVVTAEGMSEPAEFEVAFEPFLSGLDAAK